MHIITRVAVERLREHKYWSLIDALHAAHAIQLSAGRTLITSLEFVLPLDEWHRTYGDDAIAALELADP